MIGIKIVSGLLCGLACLLALAFCVCESAVPENCGDGNKLNPETEFCYGGKAYPKCGGGEYDPTVNKCENNVLKNKCEGGDKFYDPATEFCTGESVHSKCGGKEYDPASQTCESNVLKTKCGNSQFNPATEICSNDTVYSITYTLNVSANPASGGSVNRSVLADNYATGTSVILTAVPSNCYRFVRWSGNASGTSLTTTVIINSDKSVTAEFASNPTTGSNILQSPNFASIESVSGGNQTGSKIWTLRVWGEYDKNPPSASHTVNSGVLSVVISNSTGSPEHVQVFQESIALTRLKKYRLTFDAYASSNRKVDAVIQKNGSKYNNDWTDYFSQITDLTTSRQTFTYNFTMSSANDNDAIFTFNIGSSNGTVTISNVSLAEILCE